MSGNMQERAQVEALSQHLELIVDKEVPDYWHWDLDKGDFYTMKSMCRKIQDRDDLYLPTCSFPSRLVWKLQAPLKVKLFSWAALWERTLTVDNLNRRGQTLALG
ncbi:hypothetical protein FRX31_019719, partial [Thalictrum thalictroides]